MESPNTYIQNSVGTKWMSWVLNGTIWGFRPHQLRGGLGGSCRAVRATPRGSTTSPLAPRGRGTTAFPVAFGRGLCRFQLLVGGEVGFPGDEVFLRPGFVQGPLCLSRKWTFGKLPRGSSVSDASVVTTRT